MAYPNGQVPFSVLIHLGANFWLPAGTAARWSWFVAEGIRRFGVTFRITPDRDGLGGWNAYRPLSAQVLYKKHYGNMAATAGQSSHGGFYRGQEVFAIDVDNWASVPWDDFAALAAEAGFRTNFVTPTERWHIGDFNDPWTIPAFTQETKQEDDEIMKPFFDKANRIYWPNGYYSSYPQVIYNALYYYFYQNPGVEQAGTEGTVTREIWVTANYMWGQQAKIAAQATSEVLKASGIPVDVDVDTDEIAKKVIAGVGVPLEAIDYDKIAKDVRAEFRADPLVAS